MILYAVFMATIAILFLWLGIMLRRGKTDLIHDYHQANIPADQKTEYGKAFSISMFTISIACFASGLLGLLKTEFFSKLSLFVLIGGLILSIAIIIFVQKKYNGGLF